MKTFLKLLRLDFLPRSADGALLVLRLWAGLTMLLLHGWAKLTGFNQMSDKFIDLLGIGSKASLALAIFSEFFCSILLVLGFCTRFAALSLGITMGVAFFKAHSMTLKGPGSGELAFIYLAIFFALFVAGGGRFSLDGKSGGKAKTAP